MLLESSQWYSWPPSAADCNNGPPGLVDWKVNCLALYKDIPLKTCYVPVSIFFPWKMEINLPLSKVDPIWLEPLFLTLLIHFHQRSAYILFLFFYKFKWNVIICGHLIPRSHWPSWKMLSDQQQMFPILIHRGFPAKRALSAMCKHAE